MIEQEIRLTLPMPPTLNSCFSTNFQTKRRFKSEKYRDWIALCDVLMLKLPKYTIKGSKWLRIEITAFTPIYNKDGTKKKWDIDNRIKATLDYLDTVIEGIDDRAYKEIVAIKEESDRKEVEIVIREL